MLEYQLDDAEKLLQKNQEAAIASLEQVDADLGFLRDQLTTIEVSILLPTLLPASWTLRRDVVFGIQASSVLIFKSGFILF